MRYFTLSVLLLCLSRTLFAQKDTADHRIYKVKLAYELPGSLAFMTGSYFGFRELDRVSKMDVDDIAKLNINNINAFDRPVARYSPARYDAAQSNSDLFLNISIASPVLLALDPRIRKDWLDLVTLFLVTHAVDNTVYFAAAFPVRRARPLTYNPEVPMAVRTGEARSNSFFSGHVSFSATSTFFAVKVFTDYHQIKGWRRAAMYTVAAVPPGLVGYYRMKAGKHFRTDVLLGMAVGGTCGILVPDLHRKWKQKEKSNHISLQPYFDYTGASGFSLSYTF